ncbi:MAG: signal peptidase I [Syntrophorhabdus aromaticivorans]|uniref:Signal peptidase I n=2 Tax=Syntrophorhabdus aromaticivorans TaxID=328301 RepID=A0A351U2C4_9BACT|nr:signal peptidase I [Syntrophorhabdus aromaticivorans]HBA54105.1 signal peptidase I [Syntrophorhabdus aromaticivorans]
MEKSKSKFREYFESLVIAAIIAFFVRSFFIQAFKIPSGSMEPTLLIGDHLLVNRLSYVVKVPFTDITLLNLGSPKRGDVIVFRYPVDRSKDFIKRVIATEGETVEIRNKAIYVNGRKIDDQWGVYLDAEIVPKFLSPKDNLGPVKVPKDCIFAMGDNRDRSLDSRFWGFVRRDDLVGKALILYFSWNGQAGNPVNYVRWERLGKLIR